MAAAVVVVVAFGSFQKQGKISQYFGGAAADGGIHFRFHMGDFVELSKLYVCIFYCVHC